MHDEGMLYLLFRVSKWVSKYFWGAGLKIGLCGSFMKTDHWIWNKISPMERSHDLTHSWTRGSMSYIHFARYSLLRRYSPILHSFARYSPATLLSSPTFFRSLLSPATLLSSPTFFRSLLSPATLLSSPTFALQSYILSLHSFDSLAGLHFFARCDVDDDVDVLPCEHLDSYQEKVFCGFPAKT